MNIFYIHISLRLFYAFLIFYLLKYLNSKFEFARKIKFYWYLLGFSQVSFLFFPYLKELPIPFLFLLPIKFLMLGFGFFLWVSSKVFIDDTFRLKPFHFLILTIVEIAGMTLTRVKGQIIFPNGSIAPESIVPFMICITLGQQMILSGLALHNIYKSCKVELNDTFLFVKRYFLLCAVVSEFMILLTIVTNREEHSEIRAWFVSTFNFAFLLVSFLLLKINPVDINETGKLRLSEIDRDYVRKQFDELLLKKRELLFTDCSLNGLSDELGIPEYKLRKYINSDLEFNNFNQFLNFYRIEEACRLLGSREFQSIPISRIAIMVGYNSMATFNRAFKEIKKLNPTQYKPILHSLSSPLVEETDTVD